MALVLPSFFNEDFQQTAKQQKKIFAVKTTPTGKPIVSCTALILNYM